MNSGKIILIIFVALATVMGLATIQDYSPNENESIDFDPSSQVETVTVEISDGVGSGDNGK